MKKNLAETNKNILSQQMKSKQINFLPSTIWHKRDLKHNIKTISEIGSKNE